MIEVRALNQYGDAVDQFASATSWHVDEHGTLHVLHNKGGNCATYAPTRWSSVVRSDA